MAYSSKARMTVSNQLQSEKISLKPPGRTDISEPMVRKGSTGEARAPADGLIGRPPAEGHPPKRSLRTPAKRKIAALGWAKPQILRGGQDDAKQLSGTHGTDSNSD